MGDISALRYPKKSHRKQVRIPRHSVQLAEFFGIMMGDGGINNPWQAKVTLSSAKDAEYAHFVAMLCDQLFGTIPAVYKYRAKEALLISLAGVSIVDFLVENGLHRGNKLV